MNEIENNLNLREKIFLKYYCHPPPGLPSSEKEVALKMDDALELFETHLGDVFIDEIRDKCVLDLGCGLGAESLGVVRKGAGFCYGVDIRPIYGEAEKKARDFTMRFTGEEAADTLEIMSGDMKVARAFLRFFCS